MIRGASNWISGDVNMIRQTGTELEETWICIFREGRDKTRETGTVLMET